MFTFISQSQILDDKRTCCQCCGGDGVGFGILDNKPWISFFSSYVFHNSYKLMIYRAISWIFSISAFNSANHAFKSFCNITQAICKHPIKKFLYV